MVHMHGITHWLRYGQYSQWRMMVTQDHHGDEGQPYPSLRRRSQLSVLDQPRYFDMNGCIVVYQS